MNLYVATKAENWWAAAFIADWLKREGHEITYEWWHDVKGLGPGAEKSDDPTIRERLARHDVDGARDADIVIVLVYPGMQGSFVEYGIALGLGHPVFVLGLAHPIFDAHPLVKSFNATATGFLQILDELHTLKDVEIA